MNVYAVVVSYNGALWIEQCLQSLQESSYPLSVILVDNASTDNTREIVQRFTTVTCIELQDNIGFGRANNMGIAKALDLGANYIFLLNQDAYVHKDTVGHLVEGARSHPEYGIVSPVHLNSDGSELDPKFAQYMIRHRVDGSTAEFDYESLGNVLYPVTFVNAAAWLLSSKCLKYVGGFDPIFFMYGEDDDYCNRAIFHGFRIGVMPGTFVHHIRGNHSVGTKRTVSINGRANKRLPRLLANLKRPGTAMPSQLIRFHVICGAIAWEALRKGTISETIAVGLLWFKMMLRLPKIARHKSQCSQPGAHWLCEGLEQGTSEVMDELGVTMPSDASAEMNSPVFSVIIPTHNRAHLLVRAIKSVLAQTEPNFELIIVDDASTDNTEAVVKSIGDDRIRYFRHEKGRGGAAARNSGIREARGEFVAFLDDDDEWLPEKLKKQADVFNQYSGADLGVVVCGSSVQKAGSATDQIARPRGWVFESLLAFKCHTTTSTLLVRRSGLEHVGGFDEAFPAFQEWDLLLRLSKEYQFDYVDEALHIYYVHDGDRVSNPANEIRAMRLILVKYADELRARPQIMALHHYKLARMYMRTGRMAEAKEQMAASLRASPLNGKRWLLFLMTSLDAEVFGKFYGQYVTLARIKDSLHKGMGRSV